MAYATINKPSEYFNTVLYTGNNSTQSITGVGFQPDFSWIKCRNAGFSNLLFDVRRGATYFIKSNSTDAEASNVNFITSFDSDGFSLGNDSAINGSGNTYASWNWLGGGTGVSNTDGSITSTVSASTTSGFSIVSYTGTGSNATVGHGLGVAPSLIITKSLVATQEWCVYHKSLGATKYLFLNEDTAEQTGSVYWQDTAPTPSLFSVGTSGPTNSTSAMIAYCFAEKKGFSKFGSYTGNGSTDGTFIYTGFKPAFILIKRSASTAAGWCIFDNKRDGYNPNKLLLANNTNVESSPNFDIVSNGFKTRTADGEWNGSGSTYIYMAFAEEPLVGTNNIPATAR
jgi:hypothetical protein